MYMYIYSYVFICLYLCKPSLACQFWLSTTFGSAFWPAVSTKGKHLRPVVPHSMSVCPFQCWLVVCPPKNISQLGWLFPIYGKNESRVPGKPSTSFPIQTSIQFRDFPVGTWDFHGVLSLNMGSHGMAWLPSTPWVPPLTHSTWPNRRNNGYVMVKIYINIYIYIYYIYIYIIYIYIYIYLLTDTRGAGGPQSFKKSSHIPPLERFALYSVRFNMVFHRSPSISHYVKTYCILFTCRLWIHVVDFVSRWFKK